MLEEVTAMVTSASHDEDVVGLLPPEIISFILQLLNGEDLCSIGKVNKILSIWSNDAKLWKEVVDRELNISTSDLPFWATSWKCVWGFHLLCRKQEFLNGEMKNRLGTFTWSNGTKYEGEWKDDKEHGLGIKIWSDGARYEGLWEEGKFQGYGKHTWSTGSFYIGFWDDHKRTGKGCNTWSERDRYSGDWLNDQKHGTGIYFWHDGRRYEGQWESDKRSGKGVFIWPSVGCYEGEWRDDCMNGQGKFVWEDGESYEGNWNSGCRFGVGKFTSKDGTTFEQDWKEYGRFDANNKGSFCRTQQFHETEPIESIWQSLKRKFQNTEDTYEEISKKKALL